MQHLFLLTLLHTSKHSLWVSLPSQPLCLCVIILHRSLSLREASLGVCFQKNFLPQPKNGKVCIGVVETPDFNPSPQLRNFLLRV